MNLKLKNPELIWPFITFLVIFIWSFIDATSKAMGGSITWDQIGVDFHVMHMFSRQVVEQNGVYPLTPYPYPPPQ